MTPAIGFRLWRIEEMLTGPRLASPYRHCVWVPHVALEAECREESGIARLSKAHRQASWMAPLSDCSCGIYAYHEPERMLCAIADGLVGGAVLCWGRVVIHNEGLRAQFARPLALAATKPIFVESPDRNVTRLAAAYGVPLLTDSHLGLYAREFGESVKPPMEASNGWFERLLARWFRD